MSKLGLTIPPRDLSVYQRDLEPKSKPQIIPIPNRFFSPIPDNRDMIMNDMKRDLDRELAMTFEPKPRITRFQ